MLEIAKTQLLFIMRYASLNYNGTENCGRTSDHDGTSKFFEGINAEDNNEKMSFILVAIEIVFNSFNVNLVPRINVS